MSNHPHAGPPQRATTHTRVAQRSAPPGATEKHGNVHQPAACQLVGLELVAGISVNESKSLMAPTMKKATAENFLQHFDALRVFQ